MHEPFYGAEQPSRVVIDLEKQKDQVKLTVTHDDFAEGSKVFDAIIRRASLKANGVAVTGNAGRWPRSRGGRDKANTCPNSAGPGY
jgi:hypothetical protein